MHYSKLKDFPQNFLWGASTSAYQVEGAIAEDGKSPSIIDMYEHPSEVNEKGIEFYNNVIDECLKYNIEPVITMYHFDLPYCLEEKGGWLNRDTIEAFIEYAKVLFDHFGSKVKYWLTINEQNTMILHPGAIGLPKGGKLPSKKDL